VRARQTLSVFTAVTILGVGGVTDCFAEAADRRIRQDCGGYQETLCRWPLYSRECHFDPTTPSSFVNDRSPIHSFGSCTLVNSISN